MTTFRTAFQPAALALALVATLSTMGGVQALATAPARHAAMVAQASTAASGEVQRVVIVGHRIRA